MPCDERCAAKVILNSGNSAGIMQANDRVVNRMRPEDFDNLDGSEAIKLLNQIEDDSVRLQKLLAKAVGYDGPTGKMLE